MNSARTNFSANRLCTTAYYKVFLFSDLGRMYSLVKSSMTGLRSMVQLLEDHIKLKGI